MPAPPELSGYLDGLELIATQAIYRSDAVVRRAGALQAHPLNLAPRAVLNPRDAAVFGLSDGDTCKASVEAGTATLPVATSDKVAPGCVWIERGHGATAPLAGGRVRIGGVA